MERIDKEEHFSFWSGEKTSRMSIEMIRQLLDQAYSDPDPGILRLTMALITNEEWGEYTDALLRETPSK